MADFGSPVAQNVDVSPNKGLTMLGDLMGLQQKQIGIEQQRQNLQTGQALQQQEQAQAQKQQQGMAERQLLQSSMKSGKDPDGNPLLGENGEADPVAMSKFANKFMPLTGQDVVQHIVQTQETRLKLGDATRQLGQNYKNDLAGIVRSSMGDQNTPPDATGIIQSKIDAYVQQQGANAPAALSQAASYAKSLLQNLNGQTPPDKAKLALTHLAQGFEPTQSVAAQQQPTIGSVTGPEGGMQLVQTNPMSPIPMGPVGPEVKQGIAPQIVTPPGGVPQPYAGGRSAIPTSYGPGPAPTSQDVERFGAYSANLNNRVAVASDMLPRIQQAEGVLSQVKAGGGADVRAKAGKILQAMGAPQILIDGVANGDLAATQAAEKYLFQITFSGLKQSMQGDPARVAEFDAAAGVFPSIGTDPKATGKIMKFMSDQGARDYAEQQALVKARTDGTFNPVLWESQWQQRLRAGSAPGVPASQVPGGGVKAMPTGAKLTTYATVHFGGDTAKATEFLKAHGYQ